MPEQVAGNPQGGVQQPEGVRGALTTQWPGVERTESVRPVWGGLLAWGPSGRQPRRNKYLSLFPPIPAGASMAKQESRRPGSLLVLMRQVHGPGREQNRPRVAPGCNLKTPSADPGVNTAVCLPFSEHELISRPWE